MNTWWEAISGWTLQNQSAIVEISITILVAALVIRFGEIFAGRIVAKVVKSNAFRTKKEELKRERTITQIISGLLQILIWPVTFISIAGQLGANIGPLIAGAGIIGVALGFGAQSLVKDMIAGLFIIAENQYGVGDVVNLDGTSGLVEEITLRKTKLRDADGVVHHVPNGGILIASNMSSEFSSINLNVGVAYDSDIEKVTKVVNKVGKALADDPQWSSRIIEAPAFLRVDNFGPYAVDVKIMGKVEPLAQWDVTGELRHRLFDTFHKEGIEIPVSPLMGPESKKK